RLLWKLVAWVLVILIGMSIPGDKKIRYILPMAPALALLTAYPFLKTSADYFKGFRRFVLSILLYLPALFMLGIEVVYFYAEGHALDFQINYLAIVALLISLQLISLWLGYSYIKQPQTQAFYIILIAAFSFVLTYIIVIEPIELFIERGR